METTTASFKAIKRVCLNNWHYIDHKVLSFHSSINFFTGHSGSGKSTVLDALQILLYANTDGRSFFNKAASDDSDRSLIEYLRGMINISETNQGEYKRNQNFSTTIVMELEHTITREKECIGVVFDVDTSTNHVNRLFFYHKGEMPLHVYRKDNRALSISELREELKQNYEKDDIFYTSNNERYRRNLYDLYLGGLDVEKFPRLFKRAIPFRMNIRLEEFVKEYICMEQDIHIEDMQESVILYGRMCQRIEKAMEEIRELEEISTQYQFFEQQKEGADLQRYYFEQFTILAMKQGLQNMQEKINTLTTDISLQDKTLESLKNKKQELEEDSDTINRQIMGSGYGELEQKYQHLDETIHLLEKEERRFMERCRNLSLWETEDITSNNMLWEIEKFQAKSITSEEIKGLKRALVEIYQEVEKSRQEAAAEVRSRSKQASFIESDLLELKLGKKAYPRYIEDARYEITNGLYERTGKKVTVRILADLLDIRHETWRNAIEGYLGNHKLSLIVEPQYVKLAMDIYESLDEKKYHRISLVDTEKIAKLEKRAYTNSLAEEVVASETYVKAYVEFLLGKVKKCESIEELRVSTIGITPDCMVYQNFQLKRLDPKSYTERAFIGDKSTRQRQNELLVKLEQLKEQIKEYEEQVEHAKRILKFEYLLEPVEEYQQMILHTKEKEKKVEQAKELSIAMESIGAESVDVLKFSLQKVREEIRSLDTQMDQIKYQIHDQKIEIEKNHKQYEITTQELLEKQKQLIGSTVQEESFREYVKDYLPHTYQSQIKKALGGQLQLLEQVQMEKDKLLELRSSYLKKHPNRSFSVSEESNAKYEELRQALACEEIEDFQHKAAQQAKSAVEHLKEDFIYKIRSAIKEAFIKRDELNKVIKNLNFGKDRYQFKITKNNGEEGAFYEMFMDEDLEIDPSTLSLSMKNQLNLFSIKHEHKYAMLMNDLIQIFIPPDNASEMELEEAKRNMQKYADYRTYLSFEMEQIVKGEEELVIGLSKMIKKNSGGEGQNPLYVALLASFAQTYHIQQSTKMARRPSIRLVVLDEAFSKMDAEKVASCIELIRGLGFQAIISATNDKIQNYIENVDKTFVYANPNKKSISIQEFEKTEFTHLVTEEV